MSYRRYRASTADDRGMTRQQAAVAAWKALNDGNIDPATLMDSEEFNMGEYYMRQRLERMWYAMFTVFPHYETSLLEAGIPVYLGLMDNFINWWFLISKNRVWGLIKDDKGLSKMRLRLDDYLLLNT